jgi:hypothetical protein
MIKIIISSSYLLKKLSEYALPPFVVFVFNKGSLGFNDVLIGCECNAKSQEVIEVEKDCVERLIRFLKTITDQPLSLGFDSDGWVYIKEAII